MFEILGGGLLGSIFGGLFRLAPEVLKFLDKKNERSHELSMFQLQTDLEKLKGQFRMEEKYVDYSVQQLDTIKAAFEEQAQTAQEAGKVVAAISALVRPGITWSLFFMYAAVKAAALVLAFQTQAPWHEVILKVWDEDDFAMFNMCLTFWFVGRSIEKYQRG
jgi:multidrug efflux pump subunit AcrA (membrane-fusion protein)